MAVTLFSLKEPYKYTKLERSSLPPEIILQSTVNKEFTIDLSRRADIKNNILGDCDPWFLDSVKAVVGRFSQNKGFEDNFLGLIKEKKLDPNKHVIFMLEDPDTDVVFREQIFSYGYIVHGIFGGFYKAIRHVPRIEDASISNDKGIIRGMFGFWKIGSYTGELYEE